MVSLDVFEELCEAGVHGEVFFELLEALLEGHILERAPQQLRGALEGSLAREDGLVQLGSSLGAASKLVK